jgi:hypothetical protein
MGTFDKESWVRDRLRDVTGLTVSSSGDIVLRMRDGHSVSLTAP